MSPKLLALELAGRAPGPHDQSPVGKENRDSFHRSAVETVLDKSFGRLQ